MLRDSLSYFHRLIRWKNSSRRSKAPDWKEVQGEPVMEQCYRHRDTGETAVAAYLDYNRVYVADWGGSPAVSVDSTKEAVGYYADWLDRHASDEAAVAAQRPEALQKAKAVRWENTEVEK